MTAAQDAMKKHKKFNALFKVIEEEKGIDMLEPLSKRKDEKDNLMDEIIGNKNPDISLVEAYIILEYGKERLPEFKERAEKILKETKSSAEAEAEAKVDDRFLKIADDGRIKGVDVDAFVDYLLENNSFKTIYWETKESIYVFKEGIWLLKGRKLIETIAEKKLLQHGKRFVVSEIVAKVKRQTAIDLEEFNKTPEGIICIENGVLDLNTGHLSEFKEEYNFKVKIPLFFDSEAKCPAIMKFFSEVLYDEHIPVIEEWFGFNLHNRYFEKKAIILYGEADTGKSITMNILKDFLGKGNVSDLSLYQIGQGNGFKLLDMKDKYANIHDDLSSADITFVGGFKMATGQSTIRGEHKFGDSDNFCSFAKITFAANKIPNVKDTDNDAYFGRWMPIPYDNKFSKDEQDKNLMKKLLTKKEMSGLLNLALTGLKRLRENNGFTFNKSPSEVKIIMMRSGHPLSAFAQDCLEQMNGNRISKRDMFAYYTLWCSENQRARMTKDKFGKQLEKAVHYILSGREKERYWINARLNKASNDRYDTFLQNKGEVNDKTLYMFSEKASLVSKQKEEKEVQVEDVVDEPKEMIYQCIYDNSKKGCSADEIQKATNIQGKEFERILSYLLEQGLIFQGKAGTYFTTENTVRGSGEAI